MTKKEKILKIQAEFAVKKNAILAEREVGSLLSNSQRAALEVLDEEEHSKIIKIERQGVKPMTKTVVRVFDKNDECSMTGKNYFLVLEEKLEKLNYYKLEPILVVLSTLPWQTYNTYAVGTVDIYKDELMWSEIMNYNMQEILIDVDRVNISYIKNL